MFVQLSSFVIKTKVVQNINRMSERQAGRQTERQTDRQISDRKTYYYKTHCPICEIINTTNLKTNLSVHMNIYLNTVVGFCFIITLTT